MTRSLILGLVRLQVLILGLARLKNIVLLDVVSMPTPIFSLEGALVW